MIEVNENVAGRLDEVARLLEEQGENPFRVRAYRRAAETVRALDQPIGELLQERGLEGLEALPGVGESIARSIRELVLHGRLPFLERLRGAGDPVALLRTVPGIGPRLAARLHHELDIDSLEDLELAAHDGRLERLAGIGGKRLEGIRDTLAHRLARLRAGVPAPPGGEPPVAELLDVDAEYRGKARAGLLRRIAPRRFNPRREAWLPVLHTTRGTRHYTALFSNTPRAHQLGKTQDWVVLYVDGGRGESQCTVITAERGPARGRRIVRAREAESLAHYGLGAWGAARRGSAARSQVAKRRPPRSDQA
jgi:hypothetical protein